MCAHSFRDLARAMAIALFAALPAMLPSVAAAARGGGDLSPRLAELASPSLRGASPARQARALGLSRDGMARRGRRVLVDVRFDDGALAARAKLREAGAKIVSASGRYQTITAAALPESMWAISRVPGVDGVTPVFAPVAAEATCPSGSIVSEGDVQLKVEEARAANPGIDGSGITVGILSDSFDQASEVATDGAKDVENGDLPGANECTNKAPVVPVGEADKRSNPTDEGRAMAQIVHDLAPGAQLKFATAFNSETSFADNIRALAAAGADVIVDDVLWPAEPFFQDGPIAVAVNDVVKDGVAYFSAAGNNNLTDDEGRHIASWETPEYRDAGSCPPAVQAVPGANASHCLDFNPGTAVDKTFGIKVEPGKTLTVDLQWDEPWNGVGTDFDAFLLNAAGELRLESRERADISGKPVEFFEWTNTSGDTRTVQLVVNRFSGGGDPRIKFVFLQNCCGVEATEYPQSSGEDVVGPTIFGHSGSASAVSVGAVFREDVEGKTKLEPYSSHGPVIHDFGPVEGSSKAGAIPETQIFKPDLVATDCVRTSFFSILDKSGFWRFCGTSAAAPHAAAVAALMLDRKPTAEPDDIRGALTLSATELSGYGPCEVGAGLVEAEGAVASAFAEEGEVGPVCEPPESVDPEEAAAPGDWGNEIPPPVVNYSPSPPTTPQPPVDPPPVTPKPRPRTFFLQHPSKVVHTLQRRALAVFLFGSNESDVSFACRIDGSPYRHCARRLARRFPPGWHLVEVAARNDEGLGDRSPARYRFKVKRVR